MLTQSDPIRAWLADLASLIVEVDADGPSPACRAQALAQAAAALGGMSGVRGAARTAHKYRLRDWPSVTRRPSRFER